VASSAGGLAPLIKSIQPKAQTGRSRGDVRVFFRASAKRRRKQEPLAPTKRAGHRDRACLQERVPIGLGARALRRALETKAYFAARRGDERCRALPARNAGSSRSKSPGRRRRAPQGGAGINSARRYKSPGRARSRQESPRGPGQAGQAGALHPANASGTQTARFVQGKQAGQVVSCPS